MTAISKGIKNQDYVLFNFEGFSMFPYFKPGDRLIVKKGISTPFKIGDIVLFKNKQASACPRLTAHRIVRIIANNEFITKGDNLFVTDPGVRRAHEIVGQAVVLIRKNRMLSLTEGFYGRLGKHLASWSLKNLTPGIIYSRLKHIMRTGISR